MKYYRLIVKGDVNDAAYITKTSKIDINELNVVKKVIPLLKGDHKHGHNWDMNEGTEFAIETYGDTLTEDDIYILEDLFPYSLGGNLMVHTIESIEVLPWVESEKLM